MICIKCKNKPVARGIKFITCFKCGKNVSVNSFHQSICEKCSEKLNICQYCGKEIINKEHDK